MTRATLLAGLCLATVTGTAGAQTTAAATAAAPNATPTAPHHIRHRHAKPPAAPISAHATHAAHGKAHHEAAVQQTASLAAITPIAAAAVAAQAPPEPAKGSDSGLPIPRFAALRSDEVSLRAGPGTRYPIDWIYQRRYLPVKIEREFEVWRLVSEPDGTKGWVHEAMLTGRRGFLITGDQPQTMREAANPQAAPVAILKPGVVGRLISCPAGSDWCEVQAKNYTGWLPRDGFWGTLPSETVSK